MLKNREFNHNLHIGLFQNDGYTELTIKHLANENEIR